MLLHSHKLMFVHTDDLTLTSNSDKINGALEEKLFVEKIFLLLNRIFFCVWFHVMDVELLCCSATDTYPTHAAGKTRVSAQINGVFVTAVWKTGPVVWKTSVQTPPGTTSQKAQTSKFTGHPDWFTLHCHTGRVSSPVSDIRRTEGVSHIPSVSPSLVSSSPGWDS